MAILLGIDVATSGTKALLTDPNGKILASSFTEHSPSHPKPGWSEQDPEEWFASTSESIRKCLKAARIHPREITAIGLTGQMHGSVFLDSGGKPLRPAILWNDQRTDRECEELTSRVGGRKRLLELVSNPAFAGFTAPKILWLRKNEPERFEKIKQVLLPKDYIRYRLTGEFATEVSDASGTLLLDIKKRTWSSEMLKHLDLSASLLPPCYESPEISAKTSRLAEADTTLPSGIPVAGGAGDQAAGAVGNGIVESGVISATMGTSGVVFAFSETVATDPLGRVHTFCHAVPGKWHIMGAVLSAGGSLQWFRNQLGKEEVEEARKRGCDAYELLTALAEKAPPGSEGLFFLPSLTGERTPHADPYARAAWVGLTLRHGKAHLVRSVMEGATFAMRDSLEIIRALGVPISEIRASGGGARSAFWRKMQANIYNFSVCTINVTEGPAFGAALLAGVGAGVFSSVEEACAATVRVTSRTEVEEDIARLYEKYYGEYRRLYQSLKGDFAEIHQLLQGEGVESK